MKICIIALGRLGSRLFNPLNSPNNKIIGTYNQTPKGIDGEIKYNFQTESLPNELKDSDVLIFNLTPSSIRSLESFKNFVSSINTNKFIFISSTSVYGMQGKVDEDIIPIPETDSGKLLKQCEDFLQDSKINTTIIRPSGLYSDDMHPGQYLAGRELSINGKASVNLIHYNDVVDIVIKAIDASHKLINATNSHHPNKQIYYTDYCLRKGLEAPIFSETCQSDDKIITSKFKEFQINKALP